MSKKIRMCIWIEEEIKRRAKAYCAVKKIPLQELVARLLNEELGKKLKITEGK